MYCPKCSAQNEQKQKYCSRCGLKLAPVRLVLEGRTEEAIAKFKKGRESISGGVMTLGIWGLCALINTLIIPSPWNAYVAIVNLVLGLVIAVPMAITGYARLSRAERLLNTKDDSRHILEGQLPQSDLALPKASATNPLFSRTRTPGSVTEQTTRELKSSDERIN